MGVEELIALAAALHLAKASHDKRKMEKRLGADFYKVPRATAVRILSVVRESILWILKLFSERQRQNASRVLLQRVSRP